MRDRIFRYLQEKKEGESAEGILQAVLNIRSPNALAAEKVLKGILGDDPRFGAAEGRWRGREVGNTPSDRDFDRTMFVFLEKSKATDSYTAVRGALFCQLTGAVWEFELAPSAPLPDIRSLRRQIAQAESRLLAVWSRKEGGLWNRLLISWGLEAWSGNTVSLRRLAMRVLSPIPPGASPEDISARLGIAAPDPSRPARMVRFMADCLPALLEQVPEKYRSDPLTLNEWIERDETAPDFNRFAFDRAFLKSLPTCPGVYVMRNRAGSIIYVGKSRNLKRRVGSYFRPGRQRNQKSARILDQLHSLEVLPTGSEVEALLLEMRMIRDFQPPINLQREVHEQAASYGKEYNLLLLVVEPDTDKVQLYFLKEGVFADRQGARLKRAAPAALKRKIRAIYFTQRRHRRSVGEPWEKEVVFRWFSAHHRRLNYVDVDQAGSCENTLKQLDSYLMDPDLLRQKVFYR